jgi:hypothetical protein
MRRFNALILKASIDFFMLEKKSERERERKKFYLLREG